MSRVQHVTSTDGTRIGYVTSGTGPPLVMVHGAIADHTTLAGVIPLLEPFYTVHAVDRRGRGMSGDGSSYDIRLEYADIAHLVDRVAADAGEAVSLYGHSYGAACALGAAARTGNIRHLFLYEPAFQGVLPAGEELLARLEALVAAGSYDDALEHAYRVGVGSSASDVAVLRGLPSWPARRAAAPTMPREFRTAASLSLDTIAVADIHAPTSLLLGDQSTERQSAVVAAVHAALPGSEVVMLPGQAHAAQATAPHLLADVLRGSRGDELSRSGGSAFA